MSCQLQACLSQVDIQPKEGDCEVGEFVAVFLTDNVLHAPKGDTPMHPSQPKLLGAPDRAAAAST